MVRILINNNVDDMDLPSLPLKGGGKWWEINVQMLYIETV